MTTQLCQMDFVNANFTFERASDRFSEPDLQSTQLKKLKIIADQLQEYDFMSALKSA